MLLIPNPKRRSPLALWVSFDGMKNVAVSPRSPAGVERRPARQLELSRRLRERGQRVAAIRLRQQPPQRRIPSRIYVVARNPSPSPLPFQSEAERNQTAAR